MKRTLARSKPVLALALCAGLFWMAAGVTRAAGATITLNPFATSFNNPIGIDFFEPTVGAGQLLASAFYPNGNPVNFELINAAGQHTQFTNITNLPDELKLATVRTGPCTGGFTVGTAFAGNGQQGQIMKINPDGSTVLHWATLPGETLDLRGSLYQDRACAFGGDLIVVTANEQTGSPADNAGRVWRVNNLGAATLVADIGRHLEGVVTIPNDAARYGPLAGTAIIGDEDLVDPIGVYGSNGRIWAVNPQGGKFTVGAPFSLSVQNFPTNVPLHPEDLDLVPRPRTGVTGPEGDLFAVDFGNHQILRAPASDFADKCGLIFVTQEFPTTAVASGFSTLTWNAQTGTFSVTPLANVGGAQVGHYEHVTFWGGEDCPPMQRTQPNLRITKTSGGDVNAGGVARFTITAFNDGPGTATGVTITDTLPTGLTWTDNSASCTVTAGVLTCNIGDMLVNTSFAVTVSATTSTANCGPVVNVARVSGTNEINSPQDNIATASLNVICGGVSHGCTPGFWKTHATTPPWGSYSPSQTVGSVFTIPAGIDQSLKNETLLVALDGQGGPTISDKATILLRAAVAALLNADNGNPVYPITKAQVISQTNAALASLNATTIINLATQLDTWNNQCDIR